MKKLLLVCMLITAVLAGCSQNHFNVPVDTFASRVKALGVAPFIVDSASDIRHPQREQLISLIAETNRKNEQQFVRKLKTSGNFYTVAFLDGDSQGIFRNLFFRSEARNDATIQYNKYFWKNDELRNYIQKNNLDAVMLIVVSGLTKRDKITSISQMKSVSSDYNHLIMTAQVLDANGTVLWEYPNFRQSILNYDPIINLEYPDFSEAEANLASKANIKFKTIEGIRRFLELKHKDLLLRDTQEAEAYGKQFDEILSLLKFDSSADRSAPQTVVERPRPVVEPARPAEPRPAVDYQPANVPPQQPVAPPATTQSLPPAEEIVPAGGSTL
jgi:hypothetical protein